MSISIHQRALRLDPKLLISYLLHNGWSKRDDGAGYDYPPTGDIVNPKEAESPANLSAVSVSATVSIAAKAMSKNPEEICDFVERAGFDRFVLKPVETASGKPFTIDDHFRLAACAADIAQNTVIDHAEHIRIPEEESQSLLDRVLAAPLPGEPASLDLMYPFVDEDYDVADYMRRNLQKWEHGPDRPKQIAVLLNNMPGGLEIVSIPAYQRDPYPGHAHFYFLPTPHR